MGLVSSAECGPRPPTRTSPPSSTPGTTSRCTACGSARTSTPSSTRSAAASTRSAAGAGPGETWTVKEELAAYGADPDWFGLGDRDLATHLIRTRMLDAGYPLSEVTAALADRWRPGVTRAADERPAGRDPRRRRRPRQRPAAGDPLPGVVGPAPGARWSRRPSSRSGWTTPARRRVSSRRSPPPTPSCWRRPTRWSRSARSSACPASARRCSPPPPASRASRPIVGGAVVRGMADRCLPALGIEVQRRGRRPALRRPHRRRPAGRLAGRAGRPAEVPGVDVRRVPLLMSDPGGDRGAGPRRPGRRRWV